MSDVIARIERALSTRDYWEGTRRGTATPDSLDGLLPAFRELPDCPEATVIAAEGAAAWRPLVEIANRERGDTPRFRNALFLLLYFDCLFVYRDLKGLYAEASPAQRPWLDVACRKILLRCLEVPETAHEAQTREIVRNTWRGRLATTPMIIALAAQVVAPSHRPVIIRDMAVSDGVTTLDLAEEAARRGVEVAVTGTDLRLYLRYARHGADEVVCDSSGGPIQYAIGGQTHGAAHAEVSAALAPVVAKLNEAAREPSARIITTLAPQVDHSVSTGQYALRFAEEDAFHPHPDIREADIIRIANLLVERTEEHRGYYYRQDIVRAISRLGRVAKDGVYLFLDNFMRKVEHVGLWQKDATRGEWRRLPVKAEVAADLEGLTGIPIGPVAGE